MTRRVGTVRRLIGLHSPPQDLPTSLLPSISQTLYGNAISMVGPYLESHSCPHFTYHFGPSSLGRSPVLLSHASGYFPPNPVKYVLAHTVITAFGSADAVEQMEVQTPCVAISQDSISATVTFWRASHLLLLILSWMAMQLTHLLLSRS